MKNIYLYLFISISLITPFACQQTDTTIQKSTELTKEKAVELTIDKDSMYLEQNLQKALTIAKANLDKSYFQEAFEEEFIDEYHFKIHTTIEIGHLITNDKRHVKIKRTSRTGYCIDIFEIQNQDLSKIYDFEQESSYGSYIKDTLQDVNNDGFNDFLFHYYPHSGCCTRNWYKVALFQSDKNAFSDVFEFINPTFYPKEKIIRGFRKGYSHVFYTYRWNDRLIDTIEVIHGHFENENKPYDYKKDIYKDNQFVKTVPIKRRPKIYDSLNFE